MFFDTSMSVVHFSFRCVCTFRAGTWPLQMSPHSQAMPAAHVKYCIMLLWTWWNCIHCTCQQLMQLALLFDKCVG